MRGMTRTVPTFIQFRRGLIAAIALLATMAILLSGCRLLGLYNWSWNQRLELTVMTPDGAVRGGSVMQASYGFRPEWYGWGDRGRSVVGHSGESAFVEVAPGRYLFTTLKENLSEVAYETFIGPVTTSREERIKGFDRLYRIRETRPLPRELYRTLVTFRDINDPASVEKVDPDNLEATFGEGYRLKAVDLAITDDPKTSGKINKILPWIKEYYAKRLDGNR